jgi:iron complex transport system substrate-binding protein
MITVNHQGSFTYADFEAMDVRYADFKAFNERCILYSNTYSSGYYEWGWMEPQTILKDLAKAFHPQLFPSHQPVFFTLLY